MKLRSIIPSLSIANYVSKIFVIEDCKLNAIGFPLIANGYPGIAFQTNTAGLISNENKTVESLFLFGQTIKPIELYTTGHLTLIAYFFHPHTLKTLFRFNAKELTDVSIDLNQLQPAKEMNLKEQLLNASSLSLRLRILNDYVMKLIELNYTNISKDVLFSTQAIRNGKGLFPLKKIQQELSVSERTLRRLFDFHVGVSPKMFSRICQFDAAFQQLNQKQFSRLSDIAYENGYADQSHLIRSFKEFTSYSPSEYLTNTTEFQMLNS